MKDMFFNYDNNIKSKKGYQQNQFNDANESMLSSNPTLSVVLDAKGKRIGLAARYGVPFDLFFTVDGYVETGSIEMLLLNSNISFKLYDYWHNIVLDKTILENAYFGDNTIKVSITQEEADKLKQETYYMEVIMYWLGGCYKLYSPDNGFLTIK